MSFDTLAENKAFADKFGFGYPLLCDTDRAMGLAYGAAEDAKSGFAKRIGVVIDPEGRVREWHAKVDPKAFPSDVLARL